MRQGQSLDVRARRGHDVFPTPPGRWRKTIKTVVCKPDAPPSSLHPLRSRQLNYMQDAPPDGQYIIGGAHTAVYVHSRN